MTSTLTPDLEIADALVARFQNDLSFCDAPVVGASGGLLFPDWAPRAHVDDYRIYTNHAELPKDPLVLQALPRLLFDVNWASHQYEQEQVGTLHGPVSLWVHVLAPRNRERYGAQLMAAVMVALQSTRLSSARIIAAELAATSDVVKDRVASFDDAWEWMVGYRSPNVGVLV